MKNNNRFLDMCVDRLVEDSDVRPSLEAAHRAVEYFKKRCAKAFSHFQANDCLCAAFVSRDQDIYRKARFALLRGGCMRRYAIDTFDSA